MHSAGATGSETPVVVFGGRGGGLLAAATLRRMATAGSPLRCAGLLNDIFAAGSELLGTPVLGRFADWQGIAPPVKFLAPLHKAKEMPWRARLIEGLGIVETRWATVIDPMAMMAEDVEPAAGLLAPALATIMSGVRLGRHVGLRGGCCVGNDAILGDFVFVGANAVVGGYARIGRGAHIAPGAVVREGTSIGEFAVVGMGAVVIRDVGAYDVVAGNPARRIGGLAQDGPRTTLSDRGESQP